MFVESCKRVRLMKSSEAIGLGILYSSNYYNLYFLFYFESIYYCDFFFSNFVLCCVVLQALKHHHVQMVEAAKVDKEAVLAMNFCLTCT